MNAKHNYTSPLIIRVELDADISLVMYSEPPVGPNETQGMYSPGYRGEDAWKE
jgi:hypothetical protein